MFKEQGWIVICLLVGTEETFYQLKRRGLHVVDARLGRSATSKTATRKLTASLHHYSYRLHEEPHTRGKYRP